MVDLLGVFGALATNMVTLIGLTVAISLATRRLKSLSGHRSAVVLGCGFALVGMGAMLVSLELVDGILVDGRNVAIAASALFGGPLSGVLTAAGISVVRLLLGGDGAMPGVVSAGLTLLGCLGFLRTLPVVPARPSTIRLAQLGVMVTLTSASPALLVGFIGLWTWDAAFHVALVYTAIGTCYYPLGLILVANLVARELAQLAAEQSLRESETRFRALAETSNDWFWETDTADRVTYVSDRMEEVLGTGKEALIGHRRGCLLVDTIDGDFQESVNAVAARRQFRNLVWAVRLPNGEVKWLRNSGVPLTDREGRFAGYLGATADITEHRHAQKTIQWQASHDTLTDLPNRALFLSRLTRTLKQAETTGQRVALLFIDLDQFKRINDSFGHTVGDQIILSAAERIVAATNPADVVARLGGDEFTVITADLDDASDVERIARRILGAFEAPFRLEHGEVYISASLGIAIFPDNGRDADALMREADAALYRAKDGGRNDFRFFTPELNKRWRERTLMEGHLRKALERDELFLCYQPVVSVQDQRLVGVECLLRWKNDTLGLVPTPKFISLAEDTGLIVPIGTWVLETACKQIAELLQTRPGLRVAVNVSSRQFATAGLLDAVKRALADSGLSPGQLELEITESVLMADLPQTYQTLEALSALGVSLSLDDFGTGYSSLSYLRSFPVNVLKIDRAFVKDVTVDPTAAAMVESIITMAHGLKLTVVTEGVETQEQHALMARFGADLGQGYLYGRPMPLAELARTYCAREVA
ncbi:MAG: EAL domain-containing protein [Rhodospirillaceae bacterium]|nr:EAL domain-containing protein [Rhodospirillaceae bacterium]